MFTAPQQSLNVKPWNPIPGNAQQSSGLEREIIELFRMEKPNPTLPRPPLKRVPECHIYMTFKSLQGWTMISVKK